MDYINIDINENSDEKIIINRSNYYCSNCNNRGHTFKTCSESIISNGMIGIYIDGINLELLDKLEKYLIDNLDIFNNRNKYQNYFKRSFNLDEIINISKTNINEKIKFLMVQRKNSLGYLEFIRGRYNIHQPNTIIKLLEQMIPDEISNIINKDFDYLWNELWDCNNIKNKSHHKEYIISKQKFYLLKLNSMNLITQINATYNFNEWGFPKGRREMYESDLVCAIREFEEETNYTENTYNIFEEYNSIKEKLIEKTRYL